MKMFRLLPALACACTLGVATTSDASLLSVDFGNSGAEPGFVQQNTTNQTHTTGLGDVTIDLSGVQGLFDFATTGTNDLLYRDFYFKNNGIITMTISGPGIAANAQYDVTFWSFYGAQGRNTFLEATAGTTGANSAVIALSNSPAPSGLNDPLYSTTETYTSDFLGNLTLLVRGTGNRPAINAVELEFVPEPSSLALLGLGGLMVARRRR